jgi:hypothetical protein
LVGVTVIRSRLFTGKTTAPFILQMKINGAAIRIVWVYKLMPEHATRQTDKKLCEKWIQDATEVRLKTRTQLVYRLIVLRSGNPFAEPG